MPFILGGRYPVKSDLPKFSMELQGSLCWSMSSVMVDYLTRKDCNSCGPKAELVEQVLAGQTEFVKQTNNWNWSCSNDGRANLEKVLKTYPRHCRRHRFDYGWQSQTWSTSISTTECGNDFDSPKQPIHLAMVGLSMWQCGSATSSNKDRQILRKTNQKKSIQGLMSLTVAYLKLRRNINTNNAQRWILYHRCDQDFREAGRKLEPIRLQRLWWKSLGLTTAWPLRQQKASASSH